MSKKKPVVKRTDKPPTYTVEWVDRLGIPHTYSSTDREAVEQVYTGKHLPYINGEIRDLQIKADV